MADSENLKCAFKLIRHYAEQVINNQLKAGELTALFEELSSLRKFFDEWVGEQSVEYQLANALLVLSRVLRQTGDDSNIRHWVQKYPLYGEWFTRIGFLLKVERDWKFNYGEAMIEPNFVARAV